MNRTIFSSAAAVLTAAASLFTMSATAAPVSCSSNPLPNYNYMLVDSAYVSGCLDSGSGNLNGNPGPDAFLPNSSWVGISGGSYGQVQGSDSTTGSFSINASLWNTWGDVAIGFKFGTGDKPDEWFVYQLNDYVSAGFWTFVNEGGTGGGLSHLQLYGRGTSVPAPGTLALLGLGILGLVTGRRRK